MTRPTEYENLIRTGAFAEQPATPGAVEALLQNAKGYLEAAKKLNISQDTMPVFTTAYEGFFQVVQAVLEHYEVRTKDAGRNLAIQRVCADLNMSASELQLVSKAHARRNGTSYHSPFPPMSQAEARSILEILEKYIPVAHTLTGVPSP